MKRGARAIPTVNDVMALSGVKMELAEAAVRRRLRI